MNKILNMLLIAAFGLSAMFIAFCATGQMAAVNNDQTANNSQSVIVEDVVTNMADEAEAKTESESESLAKTIKVIVSSGGFTPDSISVKKGQPVRLAFLRKDADNCGGEVVFPKLNIKRKLPVDKPVTVGFTPKNSGEISFACGMNMMRGKVVVTD